MIPKPCSLLGFLAILSLLPALRAGSPPPVSAPRLTHPGAGQTIYFLLTDRFANGNPANDTGGMAGGAEVSGFDPKRISHYHGGDFAGLTAHLDYLKQLGITAVWVTPPFKNKAMQMGTAGYHGYWVLDFLHIDPHLGTDADFLEFVNQAHTRGLRVFMDIIVNHTADVIQLSGDFSYHDRKTYPYRDTKGGAFDERTVAYNGLNDPAAFPALAAEKSFPYIPTVPAEEAHAKNPDWLNDVTLYHNRGNSTFAGESATLGDFVGLDDVFTEHPRVVQGFIEVFSHWLHTTGVDGFRIDTAKHVNAEFWQAFIPAMRAEARQLGHPEFIEFGEIYSEAGDPAYLSEFSTGGIPLDCTLDFGFFAAARKFVSQQGTAAALVDFFARDDYYTDHDSNVHSTVTFLGNHDAGRFAYFLRQENPGASPAQIAELVKLGHGLLLLSRGQPVIYYGDEQGMIGRGGNDMQAREDMFAAQAPDFKNAPLLGTTRTGADNKFDEHHPFYQLFARLGALRAAHPALRTGAMLPRPTRDSGLFAFSRIERTELVEYLVVLNNSRTAPLTSRVPTSQPGGAQLAQIFDSRSPEKADGQTLTTDAQGEVTVTVGPLQFAVWRATAALPVPANAPAVAFVTPASGTALAFSTHETDGQVFASRQELRAEITGGDGCAEVTFTLRRASRPGQSELIGTDDSPPYRVFWRPPSDLAAGEKLTFVATVDDLRGHRSTAALTDLTIAPNKISFGIPSSMVPVLREMPAAARTLIPGKAETLRVNVGGTPPLEYQWLKDGVEIPGASTAELTPSAAGTYVAQVRNRAGTILTDGTVVTAQSPAPIHSGRIEKHSTFPSKFVAAREVDVWLPPGYDENPTSRYPVIYAQDGQNLFDPATSYGGNSWELDGAMTRVIANGHTAGAIIVGIWNTGATRAAEYLPQKAVGIPDIKDVPGVFPQSSHPLAADAYLKFLVEELKPFIDRTYRTQPGAAQTFVLGSSMGGLISAYAVVEYPAVFGGAACVSTHWPAADGAVIDYFARHLPKPGAHKFYFDFGTATLDAQYEPFQQRMDQVMRAAGYAEGRDWVTRKFPGAEHSERSWRQRADIALAFLLGN